MEPRTQETCARIAEEIARRCFLSGDDHGGAAARQIAKLIRDESFRESEDIFGEVALVFDAHLFEAFRAAKDNRATESQLAILRQKIWQIFDKRLGWRQDLTLDQIVDMGAWDDVVNAPWFFKVEEENDQERRLLSALKEVERLAPQRLRNKPGPPKGRALKTRVGGDWTPQLLRSELTRLGLSETRFAKLMGVNQKSVNKWCKNGIPDERQVQITTVIKDLEDTKP